MRVGVAVFPGSTCEHDVYHVVKHVFSYETRFVWHTETAIDDLDLVVLPGGFAHGDALRAGAMAARSPLVREVARFAARGGRVVGICNGFQILLEAGLLEGALIPNESGRFVCRDVEVRVDGGTNVLTARAPREQVLRLPVAHAAGRFTGPPALLDRLEAEGRVVLRYTPGSNPNGSDRDIAGVSNAKGNVVGLMPHPERACEALLGNTDGRSLFESILAHA